MAGPHGYRAARAHMLEVRRGGAVIVVDIGPGTDEEALWVDISVGSAELLAWARTTGACGKRGLVPQPRMAGTCRRCSGRGSTFRVGGGNV